MSRDTISMWLQNYKRLIKVIIVSCIVIFIGWVILDQDDKTNKYCYIDLKEKAIERGGFIYFMYNYVDRQDNESYPVIPTEAYIITPNGDKILQKEIEDMLGGFPGDFPGANSNIPGEYKIYFENVDLNKNSESGKLCSAKKTFRVKDGKPYIKPTIAEYEKNAYIEVQPETIKKGGSVSFTYGYLDKTNNEHLSSAITTLTVQPPNKKKFQAINAKVFPSDFPGASTNEKGGYIVEVERKVKKIDGKDEILYWAMNVFYVEDE